MSRRIEMRIASVLSMLSALMAAAPGPAFGQRDTEQIDVEIVRAEPIHVPGDFVMRVRLAAITPAEPSVIRWRYGGEGQGGNVVRGRFSKPGVPVGASDEAHRLDVGQWSAPLPVASLARRFPKKLFLTVTAGDPGRVVDRLTRRRGGYSTGVVFEFAFAYQGQLVKTFRANGPDGGTATIVIPAYRLTGQTKPAAADFLDEVTDVLAYAPPRPGRR